MSYWFAAFGDNGELTQIYIGVVMEVAAFSRPKSFTAWSFLHLSDMHAYVRICLRIGLCSYDYISTCR